MEKLNEKLQDLQESVLRFSKDNRGQLSMEGLMDVFITGVLLMSLMGVIITFVGIGSQNADPTTAIILALVPVVLVVAYLKSIVDRAKGNQFPQQ